jgi:hypothetical protein
MTRPVETFRIKTEGQPQRCDVCHQDDLFDPLSGHCSRCSALIPIFEPPVLSPPPNETNFGGLWLLGDILVTLFSGLFGLVALGAFAGFGIWKIDGASLTEVLVMVGLMLFSMPGFALLYWYVQILRERADVFQARKVWFWTVVYNTLIIAALLVFNPLLLIWPFLMVIYGSLSMERFPLPVVAPVDESGIEGPVRNGDS